MMQNNNAAGVISSMCGSGNFLQGFLQFNSVELKVLAVKFARLVIT
jgi:hypothetical protein